MADDESLRHSFDTCGIAGQRFHVVGHYELLNSSRPRNAAQQRALCGRVSTRIKTVECGRLVPSKRNLLDNASAAQSLDGNRLTGSLLIPQSRTIGPLLQDASRCEAKTSFAVSAIL